MEGCDGNHYSLHTAYVLLVSRALGGLALRPGALDERLAHNRCPEARELGLDRAAALAAALGVTLGVRLVRVRVGVRVRASVRARVRARVKARARVKLRARVRVGLVSALLLRFESALSLPFVASSVPAQVQAW